MERILKVEISGTALPVDEEADQVNYSVLKTVQFNKLTDAEEYVADAERLLGRITSDGEFTITSVNLLEFHSESGSDRWHILETTEA